MSQRSSFVRFAPAAALTALFICACGSAPAAPQTTTTPTTTTTTPTTGDFFESAGVRMSYTIDRPAGTGPFPGIVLGHEGGPVTKDQLFGTANMLTAQGFIVLRFDKRGTGLSGGSFDSVTAENSSQRIPLLAGDIVAAVQTLKGTAGVNAAKIGLFGVSEAGWVMPVAASLSTDVKFMATVVGPTIPVGPLLYFAGLAADPNKSFDALSALLAGYTGTQGFDPRPALNTLNIPLLYQMGTTDRVVPFRESSAVLNALIAAGKPLTFKQYNSGHELRESTTFVPDLTAWLALRK